MTENCSINVCAISESIGQTPVTSIVLCHFDPEGEILRFLMSVRNDKNANYDSAENNLLLGIETVFLATEHRILDIEH